MRWEVTECQTCQKGVVVVAWYLLDWDYYITWFEILWRCSNILSSMILKWEAPERTCEVLVGTEERLTIIFGLRQCCYITWWELLVWLKADVLVRKLLWRNGLGEIKIQRSCSNTITETGDCSKKRREVLMVCELRLGIWEHEIVRRGAISFSWIRNEKTISVVC